MISKYCTFYDISAYNSRRGIFDTLAKKMAAITIIFSRHYFQDSVVLLRIEFTL